MLIALVISSALAVHTVTGAMVYETDQVEQACCAFNGGVVLGSSRGYSYTSDQWDWVFPDGSDSLVCANDSATADVCGRSQFVGDVDKILNHTIVTNDENGTVTSDDCMCRYTVEYNIAHGTNEDSFYHNFTDTDHVGIDDLDPCLHTRVLPCCAAIEDEYQLDITWDSDTGEATDYFFECNATAGVTMYKNQSDVCPFPKDFNDTGDIVVGAIEYSSWWREDSDLTINSYCECLYQYIECNDTTTTTTSVETTDMDTTSAVTTEETISTEMDMDTTSTDAIETTGEPESTPSPVTSETTAPTSAAQTESPTSVDKIEPTEEENETTEADEDSASRSYSIISATLSMALLLVLLN